MKSQALLALSDFGVFFLSPKIKAALGDTSLLVKYTGCLLHDKLSVHPSAWFHFKTALCFLANFIGFL